MLHVPPVMPAPVLFDQCQGFIDRSASGRGLGEAFIPNPLGPLFLSFYVSSKRIFRISCSTVVRSIGGPPLTPYGTGQLLRYKTGQIMCSLQGSCGVVEVGISLG